MKKFSRSSSIFGTKPLFERPIPIGQLYFPSWERYEVAFRGIFDRQYYNNNGPLLGELEEKLQEFLGVKHAICVSNGTLGLMMAVDALQLSGKVILPSFTFIASAQALTWAGLEPVFCDVHPDTHQIDLTKLDEIIDPDVSAIMGVNLWGGTCNPGALEAYAEKRGIALFFDSAHGFGVELDGKKLSNFGNLEVFSFHATKILSATEGGCICTNDDGLASRIRSIRPSYGDYEQASVLRVANARMSEAQAAIALMSLEDFSQNRQNNQILFEHYRDHLEKIPGIHLVIPAGMTVSNYQYVVCEVDEKRFGLSRDQLIDVLKAENVIARRYFYPGAHRTIGYESSKANLPVTDKLCLTCIQLPIGAMVDKEKVEKICELVSQAQNSASSLKAHLMKEGAA